jgi:hypothetical protein
MSVLLLKNINPTCIIALALFKPGKVSILSGKGFKAETGSTILENKAETKAKTLST